jgi:predicted MFS family arabinose efflux permease
MTVYGQWFNGTIDDLRRDTVYISGQAFSYTEIGAISRERTKWSNKANGAILATAGVGLFIIGAVNGGLRGDQASQWYTTSGIIIGSALIASGVILVATAKKYYKLGGKFKLQYLQIGR